MLFRLAGAALAVGAALTFAPPRAAAQADDDEVDPSARVREEVDQTRLDVERLPAEALPVTRALYAHGFFFEAQIGARGFVGGVGEFISPGPWATIHIGYEIFDWLMVLLGGEGSMHRTAAEPPPAPTAFELVGGTVSLRAQANFTSEFALWLSGQFGLLVATTDILGFYGFQDAGSLGVMYGGELGADWHLRARHHSIGLSGGVRHYPSLESAFTSAPALGIHGAAYLRYVF